MDKLLLHCSTKIIDSLRIRSKSNNTQRQGLEQDRK